MSEVILLCYLSCKEVSFTQLHREREREGEREGARALSQREREREGERESPGSLPDCSRRERSKMKHITQGLYRKKLALSDTKSTMSAGITTWWVSDVRGYHIMLSVL